MDITLGKREKGGGELGCLLRVAAVAALSQIVSKRDSHSPFLWQDAFLPSSSRKVEYITSMLFT